MRPACSDCKFKEFPRGADITLGDFWGIKLQHEGMNIENGTSLVMINSEKGKELFEEIKVNLFFEEKTLEEALEKNPSIVKAVVKNVHRDEFMKQINNERIDKLIKKYCKNNIVRKIKIQIKSILNR